MKRESDAHAALSQTSKLRMLDALGREIVRERRKSSTIGERKPVCTCGSADAGGVHKAGPPDVVVKQNPRPN